MTPGDRTPAADPARLTERDLAALEDRCARLHAALTAHPRRMQEAYDVKHEDDPWDWIPDVVAALRAAWAENARYRAALEKVLRRVEHPGYGITTVEQLIGLTVRDLRAALAAPGAGETDGEA